MPRALAMRASELDASLGSDPEGEDERWLYEEEKRGAAELLAALSGWDAAVLRRALMLLGDTGRIGHSLLVLALKCAREG